MYQFSKFIINYFFLIEFVLGVYYHFRLLRLLF